MVMLRISELPKYDAYKDSGEDWIDQIPSHWEIRKLKNIFYEKKHRRNMNLNSGAISFGKVVVKGDEKIQESTKASYQEVLAGDFLINPLNLNYDLISLRIALSEIDVVVSAGYIVIKEHSPIDKGYFKYLLHRYDVAYMKLLGSGVRQTISFNHISNSLLLYPTLEEQALIAKFLDKKTTQIDEAIAIKEQQIALLKERKQIIIQKSVTQGLDPTVPMKDSGVDWIGKIPAHWEVKQLKHLLSEPLKYGANESGVDYQPELPRYIRITDFSGDGQLSDEKKLSLPWRVGREYLLGDSDILLARSGATVGKSYQFKKSMSNESSHCFAGYLIKATADNSKMISDYLYLYLGSDCFTAWKSLIFNKATIENIGADKYASLFVVVPPLSEQKEILGLVREKLNPISLSIDTFLDQIRKLKEYKTTLINSAVTGKIRITPDMVEA